MKKSAALILILLTFSACSVTITNEEAEEESTPSDEAQEEEPQEEEEKDDDYSYDPTGIYPYSKSFLSTISTDRPLGIDEGYMVTTISLGSEDQFYNFSILKPLLWFNDRVESTIYQATADDQNQLLGVVLMDANHSIFQSYLSCEQYVKNIFYGIEINILDTKSTTVHGIEWERVSYESDELKGIDQCRKGHDLIVVYGVIGKNDPNEIEMTYDDLEIIMDDFYFAEI